MPVGFDQEHVMYVWFDALTNYLSGVHALVSFTGACVLLVYWFVYTKNSLILRRMEKNKALVEPLLWLLLLLLLLCDGLDCVVDLLKTPQDVIHMLQGGGKTRFGRVLA